MMHHEFEQIAGYEVSYEDYTNIIEPMYLATNLSKQDFVKTLNRKAFEKKAEPVEIIMYMRVRNRLGEMMTPNGCWYYVEPVNLVGADIKTGKIIVAPLTEKQISELRRRGCPIDTSASYDFDYTDCITANRKPVELSWAF